MEEDFYATIKFKSGEEVFARVAASEEEDRTMLVIHNPVMIVELKSRSGMTAYKIEPWLKTTKDDMFIINLDDVITLSESFDVEMMVMHQQYVHDNDLGTHNSNKINRRMGYISSVTDAKEILEKIFKNSPKKT
jgi:hypothetical protein|tara:strand:+ start:2473 stop:2874 length:402 start_codon:yes stop_codon:yes gene_type:complete